jgi:TRAP transporter TAXI family solute receptor
MFLKTYGPAIAVTIIGFVIAWQFVDPAPPGTIVIATGHEDGAYFLFAEQYREILREEGINLEIRETAGSIENLQLLEDESSGVDLAFVQGGTGDQATSRNISALGSLYFEPLWVFYSGSDTVSRLAGLAGKRIAAGETGSGTQAVALTLLKDNRVDINNSNIESLGASAAAEELIRGNIDAVFVVASPRAPLVQELLRDENARLMSFARAPAYARIHHYLSSLVLPEGVIDLQLNIPTQDTLLLAATANLVARDDLHPALVSLLLQTAGKVHGEGGLFEGPGEFPNADNLDFPPDDDALRYFKKGPPFLQQYLSFRTASLLDRLKIMLLPLVTLIIPLLKIMPPAYRWQVRKKIYRWYRELQALEIDHPDRESAARLQDHLRQLDIIEDEVRKVTVPLSYADELYDLRLHINMVRNHLLGSIGD